MPESNEDPLYDTIRRLPHESNAIGKSLGEVVPKIEGVMNACKDKMSGTIQPAVDDIVRLCREANLAFKKHIKGQNCGIHPCNRAGTGVDPFNAHILALKISLQGYSETVSYTHLTLPTIYSL